MGDFADMALSETMDMEAERFEFRHSARQNYQLAYERGIIDEHGAEYLARSTGKTCRNCQRAGLRWGRTDGGWRLHEGAEVHKCAGYK